MVERKFQTMWKRLANMIIDLWNNVVLAMDNEGSLSEHVAGVSIACPHKNILNGGDLCPLLPN